MRVLVVGAGAVGQAYAWALRKGGADVSMLVRPKYREECEKGFTIHLYKGSQTVTEPVRGCEILVEPKGGFDLVILTTPSTALADEPWLQGLCDATAPAPVLMLQPGLDSATRLEKAAGRERMVFGVIAFVAYATPLEGSAETLSEGTALWFPPFGSSPFAGRDDVIGPLVKTLAKGGMPVRQVAELGSVTGAGAPALSMLMADLERNGWKLAALRDTATARRTGATLREAVGVAVDDPPAALGLVGPFTLGLLSRVAPWFFPFDIEVYLRYHFTKVRPQTMAMLSGLRERAHTKGKAAPELDGLAAALGGGAGVPGASVAGAVLSG